MKIHEVNNFTFFQLILCYVTHTKNTHNNYNRMFIVLLLVNCNLEGWQGRQMLKEEKVHDCVEALSESSACVRMCQ